MELSDYDLLGVTSKATFRIVKNAYYDLSRIYHPDSSQIIIGMSKEDREIAFKKIKTAYENIKNKMNVVEIDLPNNEIEYEIEHVIEKINNVDINDENFNERFNKEFDKINSSQNIDNPFSIYYKIPEEEKRNLQDSQIILKDSNSIKSNNIYELGVNYIEDHSSDKFYDYNKLEIDNSETLSVKYKDEIDLNLNEKLDELINLRNNKIIISEEDKIFIEKQEEIKKNIQASKNKIEKKRNMELIN